MTNNEILRRLRYLFDFSDVKMIAVFKLAECDVTLQDLSNWLKKEDDPALVAITDKELATFMNGLIIEKRGKREGPAPVPEESLSNNLIIKKLKISLDLKTDDILDLFALADRPISSHELSSFFRNPDHKSYRFCGNQYLRSFLNALQIKYKSK